MQITPTNEGTTNVRNNETSVIAVSIAPARPQRVHNRPDYYSPNGLAHNSGSSINVSITNSDSPKVKQELENSAPDERQLWLAVINEEFKISTMQKLGKRCHHPLVDILRHFVLNLFLESSGTLMEIRHVSKQDS